MKSVTGEFHHGPYLIRTLPGPKGVRGRAMLAGAIILDAQAASEAEVVAALRTGLDAHEQRARDEVESRIPPAAAYATALLALGRSLGGNRRSMLRALHAAPERTLTATQLAKAAGYPNYHSANLQFGLLGKALADKLGMILPLRADGTPVATMSLATGPGAEVDTGDWPWTMRPEVVAAIALLPKDFLGG